MLKCNWWSFSQFLAIFFALNLLFSYQVNENAPSGTFIGTLSLFDEDKFDTHLYKMVTNSNGLFMLKGNQLLKAKSADYETSKKHTISIMATDNGTNPQPYSVSRTGNRIVVSLVAVDFSVTKPSSERASMLNRQ